MRDIKQYRRGDGSLLAVKFKCDCGQMIDATPLFTITCDDCGRDYNASGQLLAPREQWGEETGESYADITAPGDALEDGGW
jgi:hypothetical protein